MARTKGGYKKKLYRRPPIPRPRRRRILVVSLLVQNPTAVIGRNETTPGVMTRARSRRIAAAAAVLPEEILAWEIFVRLPAKGVLRCRAVCRSWRRLTSAPDFLLAHHRRQPSLPLLTLYGASSTKGALPTFKHGRTLLGLHDYERFKPGRTLLGLREYKRFNLLASCDGLLLVSFSDGQFRICNPTTGRSAPLPCLAAAGVIDIAALYLHRPSGEYRILYGKCDYFKAAFYILMVRRGQSPRCIRVPSDILGIVIVWMCRHKTSSTHFAGPVVLRDCLHWDLGSHKGILVFDTVVESFRLMSRPAAPTKLCTRLCEIEGSIGFSCNDDDGRTVKIWVLQDYEREVWSFKYHVELPMESFDFHDAYTQHLVLSHKGDVLVYRPHSDHMFHCDITGKLLEEFPCDSWGLSFLGHWFKESLVKHDISLRRGCARVFQRV